MTICIIACLWIGAIVLIVAFVRGGTGR